MQRPSRTTHVPHAQPMATISVWPNRPLSQTKPVRATEWLIPRFNHFPPPERVRSAGQQHVSSVVGPGTANLSGRSCAISFLTLLSCRVTFCRKSEEKKPEGISAGVSPRFRWQPRSETLTQTPSSRHLRSVPPLRVRLPHSLSFTACRIHATGW